MARTRNMIIRDYGERRGWLLTGAFWRDALERAVRVAAGAALLALGAGAAGAGELDPTIVGAVAQLGTWQVALGLALGAFVASILTSLAAGMVGERGTAAFLPRD